MLSEHTIARLELLSPRIREWDGRESAMPKETRLEFSMMLGSTFPEFADFAELAMCFLGFKLSPMQRDIANYMQYCPRKSMVQSQRGEAKSTLVAMFAVWSLIQRPSLRVLVVSAGEDQASDVAVLIIRMIERWYLLCWLRPDKSRGDRSSYANYDVHCDLRLADKSASVSCVGITANLPGKRADLLIPDDIESPKNSQNQLSRDTLLQYSKEFASINTKGKTLYLGTFQSKDSIYKTLVHRGFDMRIWPGRFPTPEEQQRYMPNTLAPWILEQLDADPSLCSGGGLDGNRGQPTDPVLLDESHEQEKELDWGPEGYSLQYMLDTSLTDDARTKLKLSDLIVAPFDSNQAPEVVGYECTERTRIKELPWTLTGHSVYAPGFLSEHYTPYSRKTLIIDPAGTGGDEVSFVAGGSANSYIHVFSIGGWRGGLIEANLQALVALCDEFDIHDVRVEANQGVGMARLLMLQHMETLHRHDIAFTDYYSAGQKERRIIDTVGPLLRRHKLVFHTRALEDDAEYAARHSRDIRNSMSVVYQMSSITYDRDCLVHDDRIDGVAKLCAELKSLLAVDDQVESDKRKQEEALEFMRNPMGYLLPTVNTRGTLGRMLNRQGKRNDRSR